MTVVRTAQKIQSIGGVKDTVRSDVGLLYGTLDASGFFTNSVKVTACKIKTSGALPWGYAEAVQGVIDVLCANVTSGLIPSLIDTSATSFGGAAIANWQSIALNFAVWQEVLTYQLYAFEWIDQMPDQGNSSNVSFSESTRNIASSVLGSKLADLALTLGALSEEPEIFSGAKALSDEVKTINTVEAMILAPLAFEYLVSATLGN